MSTATKAATKSSRRYDTWLATKDAHDLSFGDWLKRGAEDFVPEPDECWTCRGTGLGQTDGTHCHKCRGKGYDWTPPDRERDEDYGRDR